MLKAFLGVAFVAAVSFVGFKIATVERPVAATASQSAKNESGRAIGAMYCVSTLDPAHSLACSQLGAAMLPKKDNVSK